MDDAKGLLVLLYIVLLLFSLVMGIVWTIFPFIVMGRMLEIRQEISASKKGMYDLVQELARISQELSRIGGLAPGRSEPAAPPAASAPQRPPSVTRKTAPISLPMTPGQKLSISRDSRNVGDFTLAEVRQMLVTKQLALSDAYFDTGTQEWTTLDLNPYLY